ncbi:response regulator [Sphingomonas sp. PsM26]|jgi:response regulator RpfG family c-di-GMP phosphodiesterase|nr:response regulator [Sphingomonas sp. PsM26]
MSIIHEIFVGDEPDIRSIVEMAMQLDNGIHYKSFDSGRSTLAFSSESGQHFDLGLLNSRLSYLTGIKLHKQLRLIPNLSNIVTALITAHVLKDDIAIYKSTGIAGYISKPCDPITLAGQLRGIYEGNVEQR